MSKQKWIKVNRWAFVLNLLALIGSIVCFVLHDYGIIHIVNPDAAGLSPLFFVVGMLYAHMNIKDLKREIGESDNF